jgi:hypothetical protein
MLMSTSLIFLGDGGERVLGDGHERWRRVRGGVRRSKAAAIFSGCRIHKLLEIGVCPMRKNGGSQSRCPGFLECGKGVCLRQPYTLFV